MHPRIRELFGYIDEQFQVLRDAYDAVPAEQRDARPSDDRWSTADVISHLTIVERRLASFVEKRMAEARERGVAAEGDATPILPSIDVARTLNREIKLVAPAPIDPRASGTRAEWPDYEQAHEQLKTIFLAGDGLALGEITHPHPVFGPLNMYEWLAFVGGHTARHAAQIREIHAAVSAS